MIIYYSAGGVKPNAFPETMVGDSVNLMLSFHDMKNGKPSKRFQRILNEIDKPNREPYGGKHWRDLIDLELNELPIGIAQSHFLDSGSFSLWTEAEKYGEKNDCGEWEFYETDMFWDYLKSYAKFVRKYERGLSHYANIDVLPFRSNKTVPKGMTSEELTWRNQIELEKLGIHPVPVVHRKSSMEWLKRYLKKGYQHIGLGGAVDISQPQNREPFRRWVDLCFQILCDKQNGLPVVDVHGFGMTGFYIMTRFPWTSVDSTSWMKYGAFGNILVPRKRKGKFVFDTIPLCTGASNGSRHLKTTGHVSTMPLAERKVVDEWLEFCDVPIGEWHVDDDGEVVTDSLGITTDCDFRSFTNLRFFEELQKHIETKPFISQRAEGFGFE